MNIIYIRTSTEEQEPQLQLKDCLTLITGEYEVLEEKQSAFKDKDRPIFESIKERIKSGEVTSLICWDWDRLFRNRLKLKEFFSFCKFYNCKIHSYRQQFFENFYKIPKPFDEIVQELILNVIGWMSEDESSKKSMRVKNAVIRKPGNKTTSYKGKVWGRKGLSENVINAVITMHKEGHSMRDISQSVQYWDKHRNHKFVSLGAVHKIISKYPIDMPIVKDSFHKINN